MPSPVQRYYSNHADKLDTYWHDFIQVQTDWLINRLSILFPEKNQFRIMDLGCGNGHMLSAIANHFPNAELYGIDGTPEMVTKAREKLNSRAVINQADLNEFTFGKKYDVVLSTTVLHHLDSPLDHMKEIHNGLKPDGHLFVSEIAINTLRLFLGHIWWSLTQKAHRNGWDENDFRYFIKSCDFHIENGAILSPDSFWQIQMYHLKSKQD